MAASIPIINQKSVCGRKYIDPAEYDHREIIKYVESHSRFAEIAKLGKKLSDLAESGQDDKFMHKYYFAAYDSRDLYIAIVYIAIMIGLDGYLEMDEDINFAMNSFGVMDIPGEPGNTRDELKELDDNLAARYSLNCYTASMEHASSFPEPFFYIKLVHAESGDESYFENDTMKEAEKMAREDAFVFAGVTMDSRDEIVNALDNYITSLGFSTEAVKDELRGYAESLSNKTEYDMFLYARAVVNAHLLNSDFPCSEEITAGDLQYLRTMTSIKRKDKKERTEKTGKLIGLTKERRQLDGIVRMIELENRRTSLGLPNLNGGCNMVFAGPPGTAKTTLARAFAADLARLNLISNASNFRECRKSDIVGMYVGHTAANIDRMFSDMDQSGGGVIFFDEIYSISERDATCYDTEAVTCITQNMENFRGRVFCIFAGYRNKMEEFLSANPGMRSRMQFTICFDPYTDEELVDIFKVLADSAGYKIPAKSRGIVIDHFNKMKQLRGEQFGNGREARNLLTNSVQKLAMRISGDPHEMTANYISTLRCEDIRKASEDILTAEMTDRGRSGRTMGF